MILENADPAQSCAGSQFTCWSCKTHGVKIYFDKMWIWQHFTGKNWYFGDGRVKSCCCSTVQRLALECSSPVVPDNLSCIPFLNTPGKIKSPFSQKTWLLPFYFFCIHSWDCVGLRHNSCLLENQFFFPWVIFNSSKSQKLILASSSTTESTRTLVIWSCVSFVGCVTQICCCSALSAVQRSSLAAEKVWVGFAWRAVLRCNELKACRALLEPKHKRL